MASYHNIIAAIPARSTKPDRPCVICQNCLKAVTHLWRYKSRRLLCRGCALAVGIKVCYPNQAAMGFSGQLPAVNVL